MISPQAVEKQLKDLKFNPNGWGRTEAKELPHILVPDEELYEVVNGYYEAGFALLVATNIRVLLIDKKPLNYLTVEDLRFDMINEIDYSHRLIGAQIKITTGSKVLNFTSFNQPRLRKLINHVQDCMAQLKMKQSQHQEGQVSHLEKINHQLQDYLLATQRYQQQLAERVQQSQAPGQPVEMMPPPEPVRPSPELADYLYAQGLLAKYRDQKNVPTSAYDDSGTAPATPQLQQPQQPPAQPQQQLSAPAPEAAQAPGLDSSGQMSDLYQEGLREVFGRHQAPPSAPTPTAPAHIGSAGGIRLPTPDINALRIAYSKLPMALRNRRFGRPSFHAHSQSR